MSLFSTMYRMVMSVGKLLNSESSRPTGDIGIHDLEFIWNYQMVIIPNATTLDLSEPLIDVGVNLKNGIQKQSHRFPLIVGDHGTLISPTFGRRVCYRDDPQKTKIDLEYILGSDNKTRLTLRILGKDPQSILITKDERRITVLPIVLFIYKPRNPS